MKILLDENIDNRLIPLIEQQGFEVRTTFEEDLNGTPDSEILDFAANNSLIILTHDDDFLSLLQEKGLVTRLL